MSFHPDWSQVSEVTESLMPHCFSLRSHNWLSHLYKHQQVRHTCTHTVFMQTDACTLIPPCTLGEHTPTARCCTGCDHTFNFNKTHCGIVTSCLTKETHLQRGTPTPTCTVSLERKWGFCYFHCETLVKAETVTSTSKSWGTNRLVQPKYSQGDPTGTSCTQFLCYLL